MFSWLSWGILIAFQAFVEFRDQFGNGWLLLGVIMTLILVISICYQGSAIKKLLIVAFLYAICSGVEMIVSSFMRGVSLDDRRQYDIGETLSKMIMIFLVFLFRAMVKKNGKSDIALRYNILIDVYKRQVSVWPTVDRKSVNYQEMKERDLLVRTNRGIPVTMECFGLLHNISPLIATI